jgi:hypothetical protein
MSHQKPPLSAAQIVTALGGPTSLSKRQEIKAQRSAIANWSSEGIPAKYWPALARIASETDGADHITLEVLEQHTRPRRELTHTAQPAAAA